ncbi:MAG TPA: hypothetical protein VD996_02655 [Chitinophagaceae bacterium]|nr:hypothetical protein [Chitinophagaceae bacterium]
MHTHEVLNSITVKSYALDRSGLAIYYDFAGKDMTLIATPEQCAKLFEETGIINWSEVKDGVLVLWFDRDIAFESEMMCAPWEEFAQGFRLSQYQALRIVEHHEKEKHVNGLAKGVRPLNDLMQDLNKITKPFQFQ